MNLSSIKDYFDLLKPRVMALSIFTGYVGMAVAPGSLHPLLQFFALVCIAMGAGGAGCLNMWVERERDKRMHRTCGRPLCRGVVSSTNAFAYGIILSVVATVFLSLVVSFAAGLILAFIIFFYSYVYTVLLKPTTIQNIVIGGAAGALPPVVGWACISPITHAEPWILFLVILFWTPAHFWALAIACKEDFIRAQLPMFPAIKGDVSTKKWIIVYTILTIFASLLFSIVRENNLLYTSVALVLGILFFVMSLLFYYNKISHMQFFSFSILYLFVLFSFMLF